MATNSRNRTGKALTVLAGLAVLAGGLATAVGNGADDPFASLPQTLTLSATIRDFKAYNQTGGHPDFEYFSGSTTVGLVQDALDSDGKPVAASLRGRTITSECRDSAGRFINPALYNASLGDRAPSLTNGGSGNGLTSAARFAQWFRDTPGVNVSKQVALVLNRQPNTNRYVFDSATDAPYAQRYGFFPIDGELYGNFNNSGHNFHFTTEVNTEFLYQRGQGQVFKFTGDDDVWVFIGGRLAVDLGGLHSKKEQYVDLDRLSWLQDGQVTSLTIFHAERRTTQSNFRIETTINMRSVNAPATTGLYD